ncbi:MAG TPA: polyphosphate kinase 1 [Flavipsychrobacter sp.]|nr:polyphosphate kinase 1 [Flavipsychrobacter sp.]
MKTKQTIVRDLSWLAFNARVLQEAQDTTNHVYDRLRFLGIFSNNLDEFFRVRVATLSKMARLGKPARMHLEANPEKILQQIQQTSIIHQNEFDRIYSDIIKELERNKIFIKNERQLTKPQKDFVSTYFDEEIRTQIIPLMIESIPQVPLLRDKSIYLACVLGNTNNPMLQRYALIEIPTKLLPRFTILPSDGKSKDIILLEDIIRANLSHLFAPFGFNRFLGYIIKLTRDAELELDNDINTNLIDELEKSLKNRKKGRATRFVYDKNIDPGLLDYLIKRLGMTKKDNLIAGGRIHNFKDFMNFPSSVFADLKQRPKPFVHPLLKQPIRIMEVMERKDIMLHFPYHSFDSIIDLLREAAIDPFVQSIKITCYRLAKDSKIANALVNAVRNGKQVTAMLELRARFDEEANLNWKERLEEEGVKVLVGIPDMKVHAKLCIIKKREFNKTKQYGFVSTGNFNENTAEYYGDHCLLTTNRNIIADINRIFSFLESAHPRLESLRNCKTLPLAPVNMRKFFLDEITKEIRAARKNKDASIIIKLNSLVDQTLILKLYDAAKAGVHVKMIIRGICCAYTEAKSLKGRMKSISIIDAYLEHARVFVFDNGKKPSVYISSADWMVRNLDHRIEAACPIYDKEIQQELIDILDIQLAENVKGRILDDEQSNTYVQRNVGEPEVRSQLAIYQYLKNKHYEI